MAEPPDRKRLRWQGYDYRIPAYYFVTVCTADRRLVLSRIGPDGTVSLMPAGEAVVSAWEELPGRYGVAPVSIVVMPDHVHAILGTGADGRALGTIIGAFKSLAWQRVRAVTGNADPLWQRGYHDRVIRSNAELERLGEYIAANPARWLERGVEEP